VFVNVKYRSVFECVICADIGNVMNDLPIFQSSICVVTE
jgi:hypothetical protein